MKRTVMAMAIVAWLFTPESHAQCPAQQNLVYYNFQDAVYSVDLVSGAEAQVVPNVPNTIDGVTIDKNIGDTEFVINCLASNPDATDLLYWGNDNSIFGITPSNGSLFLISNLVTDFPTVFGATEELNLDSGGGSYYDGHYYIGADCKGIYDLEMSADGLTVMSVSLFSDVHFQYGDLIVTAAGCSGFPTMYISSSPFTGGDADPIRECSGGSQAVGLFAMDMATKDTTLISASYPGQLAITASGNLYTGSGSTIQEINTCTGAAIGASLAITMESSIHDMTGPGICMQADPIAKLVAAPDFDTIPGYNTASMDVVANDPANVVPTTIMITKNGANGVATLSGTVMSYTPTYGFTGYDTICYKVCALPATNCDTVIAVFAIGTDHDMDGLLDTIECPSWDLMTASCDIDGDNVPNIYDLDSDDDTILDEYECPMYNGTLGSCNTDGDGQPDYLDTDSDDDGLSDELECSTWTGTVATCDTDGDGDPNFRDLDSDNDTFLDGTFNEFPTEDCDDDNVSDYLDPDPCDVCIPEGFSPNGDGRNDVFEIVGLQSYPNNRLKVFNRWGEEVFDQVNYDNSWGGDTRGKQEVISGDLLPVGTYYVIFEYESLGSKRSYDGICYIQY